MIFARSLYNQNTWPKIEAVPPRLFERLVSLMIVQTFKHRIYPSPTQGRLLEATLETCLPQTGWTVGIDVGEYHLLATSDGEGVKNPHWYQRDQKHLRVLQRSVSRRQLAGRLSSPGSVSTYILPIPEKIS